MRAAGELKVWCTAGGRSSRVADNAWIELLIGDIVAVDTGDALLEFGRDRFDQAPWHAANQVTGWHLHPFWDHTAGRDQAAIADVGAIKYAAVHAKQAVFTYGAGMGDGGVAKTGACANFAGIFLRYVHDAVILDVGAMAKADVVDIAADDRTKPHRALIAKPHIAN